MNSFNAALKIADPAVSCEGKTCPLCLSVSVKTLSEYNAKSLLKCSSCGVSFVFPQPSFQECASHFEEIGSLSDVELEQKFESNRARVLARVAAEIQKRRTQGSILDVGCATGIFLGRYFSFSQWERSGIDIARAACERAAHNGLRVRCRELASAEFPDESFDVVTVLDAFYYFRDPHRELGELRRVLKEDGLLALELPLATSRIWRGSTRIGRILSGNDRPLLESSDHLFYFTPRSLSRVLRNSGFTVAATVALPGNRQQNVFRDLGMRAYSALAFALNAASASRIFVAPRFLVLATRS